MTMAYFATLFQGMTLPRERPIAKNVNLVVRPVARRRRVEGTPDADRAEARVCVPVPMSPRAAIAVASAQRLASHPMLASVDAQRIGRWTLSTGDPMTYHHAISGRRCCQPRAVGA